MASQTAPTAVMSGQPHNSPTQQSAMRAEPARGRAATDEGRGARERRGAHFALNGMSGASFMTVERFVMVRARQRDAKGENRRDPTALSPACDGGDCKQSDRGLQGAEALLRRGLHVFLRSGPFRQPGLSGLAVPLGRLAPHLRRS